MRSLTAPGRLESLASIAEYVQEAAAEGGLDQKRAYALRQAVDEIATNVITHGYQEAGREGEVYVRADIDEQAVAITLEDTGVAYDPTRQPPPTAEELSRPLEERQIGGLGVYLAIQNADKFMHRRIGDRNRNVFVMNRAVHGRLLIVDDHKEHQEILTRNLTRLGYTPACVDDGEQALAVLSQTKYDLVLLGLGSPRLNALEVLERMKADNALRGIPVLMLTAEDEVPEAERLIKAGAEDYLSEPFSPVMVQARVSACLERQRVRIAEEALKESEKYEHDVQIGRQIQLSFLPDTLPQPAGWEVAALFEPAREVAGDFYDAFSLTHDRVGLVLGDVCDKGVGAALFMALFRSLIRAFAQQHYSSRLLDDLAPSLAAAPRDGPSGRRRVLPTGGTLALKNAMELTNNYIIDNHGETAMFATIFFGVLDPDTGTLLYVNGGHEPPVIFTPGHVQRALAANRAGCRHLPGFGFRDRAGPTRTRANAFDLHRRRD